MTATNGSPSPKPRAGKHHRHTKSSSSLPVSGPKKHHPADQSAQIPLGIRYVQLSNHHHHHHHHNNNSVPRSGAIVTPPQTPKVQGFVANTEASGKKKKKKTRGRQKDSVSTTKPVPVAVPVTDANGSISKTQSTNTTQSIPSGQMTPPKLSTTPVKAYAGPLFHSSPNPSALPVPKFFSKSVPATPAASGLQAMMESEDSESSSSIEQNEEISIEKLFRADKEERERMKMKRQSSGSSSSNEGSVGIGFDHLELNGNSVFEMARSSPRAPKPMDGIFSMDVDGPMSPVPNSLFRSNHSSTFNRASSAPSQIQTPPNVSKGDELKNKANLLKLCLLPPSISPKREEPSLPAPAPRAQKSCFEAGPPLTPTRNNHQASPDQRFDTPGYSPDRTPCISVDDLLDSMRRTAGPPQSPLALRGSHFRRDSHLSYTTPPRNSLSKKSVLESKLETARAPVTPSRSIAELESDLRRVLNLDTYASSTALNGGVLI